MNGAALPPDLARAAAQARRRVARAGDLGLPACRSSTRRFGSQFRAIMESGMLPGAVRASLAAATSSACRVRSRSASSTRSPSS